MFSDDIENNRGAVEEPCCGARHAAVLQVSFGGASCGTMAAGYLGVAPGQTVAAQVDDADALGGHIMSLACTRKLHAQASSDTGIRIAILMGRGNALCAVGAPPRIGRWPYPGSTMGSAMRDVAALVACARHERADRHGIVPFGVSMAAVSRCR